MSHDASITLLIHQLKAGAADAAQPLWELYFQRMVDLARRKLEGTPRGPADEEDVALSAFQSFCRGAREGRFTQLQDRDNLWPLLMAITLNKSVDLIRKEHRQKRGGGAREDVAGRASDGLAPVTLSEIIGREPTPEFAAEMSDLLQQLLQRLNATGDADLARIAISKMDGFSNVEIAEQLQCARRTVERKLALIAKLWEGA